MAGRLNAAPDDHHVADRFANAWRRYHGTSRAAAIRAVTWGGRDSLVGGVQSCGLPVCQDNNSVCGWRGRAEECRGRSG
jgi:hypothetical protein